MFFTKTIEMLKDDTRILDNIYLDSYNRLLHSDKTIDYRCVDLSQYQGLNDQEFATLIDALKLNKTLKYLSISNNRLNAQHAGLLAEVLKTSLPLLKSVKIKFNPLGEDGKKALLQASQYREDNQSQQYVWAWCMFRKGIIRLLKNNSPAVAEVKLDKTNSKYTLLVNSTNDQDNPKWIEIPGDLGRIIFDYIGRPTRIKFEF